MNQSDNRRLVVLGGGESGVGAAVLGKVKGMDVFLSDMGKIADNYKAVLDKYDIPYEEGQHTESLILNADEVVKSPGIPLTAPMIVKITEKGIPVISEIELAGRYTTAKMVCITGSNGKTTTTLLTYHILKNAGLNVGLAGNVGKSLALQVATDDHDVYVVELSSFQLDNMYDFRANVAVIMNITPDHLDRYDHKMENYARAKFRILQNQTPDDYFIYWQGDPIILDQIRQHQIEAQSLPFAEDCQPGLAAYEKDGIVHFYTPTEVFEIPRDKMPLKGLHNLYNTMAAGISASLMNVAPTDIAGGIATFEGVEHRLEHIVDINGVNWINDSKATNVNSTWYALESMTRPTVLILGGKDKGNDYSEIDALVSQKVKAIVAMGKDNAKILEHFNGKVATIVDTHSLEDAVKACHCLADEGDTVLLSPCCASFDLFRSYEDRGEQFKAAACRLKELNPDKNSDYSL